MTETALTAALAKGSKDLAARPHFYKTFCESEVYVILLSHLAPDRKTLAEGESIALQEVEYFGKKYIAVFSSLDTLRNYAKEDVKYMGIVGVNLLRISTQRELLLDPGARFGKAFTRAEMDSMLGGAYASLAKAASPSPKKKSALGVFNWLKKKA